MVENDEARGPAPSAAELCQHPANDDAPGLTATGLGPVAAQVLAIALANGADVRGDADFAELLATIELDSPIPPAVLATVAEILTYVCRADDRVTVECGR